MVSRLIDFHSHFYDRAWFASPTTSGQGILARAWPIMPIAPRQHVDEVLARLDLTELQRAAILGGNATRLLAKHLTSP